MEDTEETRLLTWGEFKQWLEHEGVTDDMVITYMDFSDLTRSDIERQRVIISIHDDGSFTVI